SAGDGAARYRPAADRPVVRSLLPDWIRRAPERTAQSARPAPRREAVSGPAGARSAAGAAGQGPRRDACLGRDRVADRARGQAGRAGCGADDRRRRPTLEWVPSEAASGDAGGELAIGPAGDAAAPGPEG